MKFQQIKAKYEGFIDMSCNVKKEYIAELMRAKGGARAIVTMTFDDGVSDSSHKVKELMVKYGLVATLMVVPSRIMGIPPYSRGYCDISELGELMEGGYIDIESHSYSHLYIAEEGHVDYKAENCNDENRLRETVGSYEWLREHFPNKHFVAFGVPGGNYDARTHEYLKKCFYAVRNGWVGNDDVQSLTPTDDREMGGWYRLKRFAMRESDPEGAIDRLDRCVKRGGWFLTANHNIVGTEIGKHNYEISVPTLERILERIAALRDEGKVWSASFGDATRYLRECEAAEVREYSDGKELFVELKMKKQTPSGLPLTSDVFNLPLTVKVELPKDWNKVKAGCITYDTFIEDENNYAYIEIAPIDGVTKLWKA